MFININNNQKVEIDVVAASINISNSRLEILRFLADNENSPCIDSGNLLSLPDVDFDDIDVLLRFGLIETDELDCFYKITNEGHQSLHTGAYGYIRD